MWKFLCVKTENKENRYDDDAQKFYVFSGELLSFFDVLCWKMWKIFYAD